MSAALAIILVAFSASVALAQVSDVKGSKDHPMVSRYEGSVIIGYDFRKFNDYELLDGPIERTGQPPYATPTKSQQVEGQTIAADAPGDRQAAETGSRTEAPHRRAHR